MQPPWRNPELIRHARVELRRPRMVTAAAVSVLLCVLLILIFFHPGIDTDETDSGRDLAMALYTILASIQALVLCLWCLSSCSQAIASERSLKTFDFLRTTRLSSWELLLGMIFGAPIMAYFVLACTLPFTFILGLYAGFSLSAIVVTYLMLVLVSVFLSLAGLTISMTTDRPRPGEVLLLVFVIGFGAWAALTGLGVDSPFPGFTAILVVGGLLPLYHVPPSPYGPIFTPVPFFGVQVPALLLSIVFYVSAGAWLLLILVRNLKKDREDIRFLSRWQAAGFAAYLNVLVLALLDLRHFKPDSANDIAGGYLGLNFLILYAVGLATLAPSGRLKSWRRLSATTAQFYTSDDGPPWPWMAASALAAFLVFVLEIVVATRFIPFSNWPLGPVAGFFFVLLAFAVRDILFLQWCVVKNFRNPVLKGVFFLFLYYLTAFILAAFLLRFSLTWLTPVGAFLYPELGTLPSIVGGIVLQIATSIFFLVAIRRCLAPPPARSPSGVATSLAPAIHTSNVESNQVLRDE